MLVYNSKKSSNKIVKVKQLAREGEPSNQKLAYVDFYIFSLSNVYIRGVTNRHPLTELK